jgi:DNA-binding IclR family transcriptional regulator
MAIDPLADEIGASATSGTQSIDRATMLLLLVGRSEPIGARLSDLVEETGLTKPTVRRVLLALVQTGFLDQDTETRRYHTGPQLHMLGTIASARFGIHPLSVGSLTRLSQASGDAAFLSVPRDVSSICLHRKEGSFPIQVYALNAGDCHPLGVGAGSLAMLAALPDEERERVMAANAEICAEHYPRCTPLVLRDLVRETRAKGYALNPGTTLPGSWGIGVSILGEDGQPAGALSIAAIESRLGEERQLELARLLTKEALWVQKRLREASGRKRQQQAKLQRLDLAPMRAKLRRASNGKIDT